MTESDTSTWMTVPVGAVASFVRGVSYKKPQSSDADGPGMIPVLRANNISRSLMFDDLVFVERQLVSNEQKVRKGDIVFAMSSGSKKHVGKSAVATADHEAGFGAFCGLLRPSHLIEPRFLAYQFKGKRFRDWIERLAKGTNINNLKQRHLLEYEVFLAPAHEQYRIVAKIEELFSELDNGVANLQHARSQLDAFRDAILDHHLGPQALEIENRPLGDLIGSIQQGWSPKCDLNRSPADGEWAVIKTTTVQPLLYLRDECKPLPDDLEPRPDIEVKEGDLLMTRKGPRRRTGVVCQVRDVRARSMLCDTVYRFRADESLLSPEYLAVALNAPRVVADLDRKKSGINESGISLNQRKIKSLLVPVAFSRERQAEIVAAVRKNISLIDKLDEEIEAQLHRASLLRQSILKKAFAGRLVSRDPKYEPASAPLERIAAERKRSSDGRNERKTGP